MPVVPCAKLADITSISWCLFWVWYYVPLVLPVQHLQFFFEAEWIKKSGVGVLGDMSAVGRTLAAGFPDETFDFKCVVAAACHPRLPTVHHAASGKCVVAQGDARPVENLSIKYFTPPANTLQHSLEPSFTAPTRSV